MANWGLIIGLILGVISTVLLVWMGNVKEVYLRRELAATGERAGHAEERAANVEHANIQLGIDLKNATAESDRRQSELEVEQRKTAQAQKETAEAQLRLKRYAEAIAVREGPRRLNTDQFLSELRGKPKAVVRIWYKFDDGEAYDLAEQIYRALRKANWIVSEPTPIPADAGEPGLNPNGPSESRFSGSLNPSGITVLTHGFNAGDLGGSSAFQALSDALGSGLMPTALSGSELADIPDGTLVIVVAKKP